MDIEELVDNITFLEDWTDRYRYLIELGRSLPPMEEAHRVQENKVRGCMSQVWLVARKNAEGALCFEADSDAHIVRGLVYILLSLYSGKQAAEILAIDPKGTMARIGLDQHLSVGRSNGLYSMVARIKKLASLEITVS
ncbi:MAG: SufE family protein [Myxococcota bacterium]